MGARFHGCGEPRFCCRSPSLFSRPPALPQTAVTVFIHEFEFVLAKMEVARYAKPWPPGIEPAPVALVAKRSPSPRSGTIPTTTPAMPFEFGDVVLVPFRFTNQAAASKKRPAVVSAAAPLFAL